MEVEQYKAAYAERHSSFNPIPLFILAGVAIAGVTTLLMSGDGAPIGINSDILPDSQWKPFCEACNGWGVHITDKVRFCSVCHGFGALKSIGAVIAFGVLAKLFFGTKIDKKAGSHQLRLFKTRHDEIWRH